MGTVLYDPELNLAVELLEQDCPLPVLAPLLADDPDDAAEVLNGPFGPVLLAISPRWTLGDWIVERHGLFQCAGRHWVGTDRGSATRRTYESDQWTAGADDSVTLADGAIVCERCAESCSPCRHCHEWDWDDNMYAVGIVGDYVCDTCISDYYHFCEHCQEWVHDEYPCDCREECECETVASWSPAVGALSWQVVERSLPAGTVSDEGMRLVSDALYRSGIDRRDCQKIVDAVGPEWQTKRGNLPKRISAAAHKMGHKLAPATLSEVGNLARANTADAKVWHLHLSRDLNRPADYFGHPDSCWWQSYAESRCSLKASGGMGLRSVNPNDPDDCRGRAWVQPLDAELCPVNGDDEDAAAWVVYNGYGDLSGYAAVRLVADAVGMPYRKISLSHGVQYVNGDTGYLVAPQDVCSATEELRLRSDPCGG